MRRIYIIILVLAVSSLWAQGSGSATRTDIAALVNGEAITKDFLDVMSDLNRILTGIYDLDEKFFNALTTTQEGLAFLIRYKMEVLDDLIDQLLIQQLAEHEGIALNDADIKVEVEREISKMLKDMGVSEGEFDDFLKKSGTSLEDMKKRLMWVVKTKRALEGLYIKVTSKVDVGEDEMKSYYESHRDEFKIPTKVRLMIIFSKSEADAQKCLERIMNGEDFSKVAEEMSIDEKSGKNGGDIGWIEEDSEEAKNLLNDHVDKVFMAPKGAILGPYRIGDRWLIIKIADKVIGGYPDFEDVKDRVREKLLAVKKNEIWKNWFKENFEKFKKNSEITVLFGSKGE